MCFILVFTFPYKKLIGLYDEAKFERESLGWKRKVSSIYVYVWGCKHKRKRKVFRKNINYHNIIHSHMFVLYVLLQVAFVTSKNVIATDVNDLYHCYYYIFYSSCNTALFSLFIYLNVLDENIYGENIRSNDSLIICSVFMSLLVHWIASRIYLMKHHKQYIHALLSFLIAQVE
jgi:hypothetical protein